MSENLIPLFKVAMHEDAIEEVTETLRSGYIGQGKKVDQLEKLLGDFLGNPKFVDVQRVVTLNSCTSALHLAYYLIKQNENLSDNTEVLATPVTCFATNVPILHNRMRIKWCDIDKNTLNINLYDVRRKLTENTRILSFVHWGGYPVDLYEVLSIKSYYHRTYGKELYVVEDAAHAFGSTLGLYQIGNVIPNNFVTFSFQAIKNLAASSDGGVLICPEWAYKKARLMRWFGLDRDNNASFRHAQDIELPGFKFHMNDVQASGCIGNFKYACANITKQRLIATKYREQIKNPKIEHLRQQYSFDSSYWLYTLMVDDANNFIDYMYKNGIESNPVHTRNDKLSVFKEFKTDLPILDGLENKWACIPCHYGLTNSEIQYIITTINAY